MVLRESGKMHLETIYDLRKKKDLSARSTLVRNLVNQNRALAAQWELCVTADILMSHRTALSR